MGKNNAVVIYGFIGFLASLLVGTGEFLLHYDPLARFSDNSYIYMLSAGNTRQTVGHFIGVLAAPLYLLGCWHIYLMLRPAGQKLAFIAFIVGAYGFSIGAVWLGSRASIGAITHLQSSATEIAFLVDLYRLRYENLLLLVRAAILLFSGLIAYMAWGGNSHYHKAIAIFNPLMLLLANFVVFSISPTLGKFLMPIALNVGFGVFFILSIYQALHIHNTEEIQ